MDTRCQCGLCGQVKHVSFIQSVHYGWPRCCSRRMRVIETKVDMEQAIKRSLMPVEEIVEQIRAGKQPPL